MRARVHINRWRGENAVVLSAGDLDATFLPDCGMLGGSLRSRGEEFVALPHPPSGWRARHSTGLPLLHPWANRLGGRTYRAAGRKVNLAGLELPTDGNGLPIHGTIPNAAFEIVRAEAAGATAMLIARLTSADDPLLAKAFPFPHDVVVTARLDDRALRITTEITATGDRAVPVAFGWHPYFRIPGVARRDCELHLPARTEIALGADQLPTGARHGHRATRELIGAQTFDHHFELGSSRKFSLRGGDRRLDLAFDANYRFAQLYVPAGKPFVAIEPMTATVDALRTGKIEVVAPGDRYAATFTIRPS